jgi:hemin uptake protein HemP
MTDFGLTTGELVLQSAGPLLFHPDGILFAADVSAAAVFAIDVADTAAPVGSGAGEVEHLGARTASLLGVERDDVVVRGMAVHPSSHAVYLSVARGRGADAIPALIRVSTTGELEVVDLESVPFARTDLDDAPSRTDERLDVWLDDSTDTTETMEIAGTTLQIARVALGRSTITDMAWVDGSLLVAGTSNEEFSSRLRRIPFPFDGAGDATSLEIYHVDHGRYETASPIRALIPFDGGRSVLATYTCTPVVHFPISDLAPDALVRGRTVAELGPMNQPLGLVAYEHDGAEYLLVSGTRHPLLKIPAAAVAGQEPLTEKLEPVGVPREVLSPEGVTWMANLDPTRIVIIQHDGPDTHLRTLQTAEL